MKIDALVNEIYEMVNPIAEELNYDIIYHISNMLRKMENSI